MHTVDLQVGERRGLMFSSHGDSNRGIIRRHRSASTERGLNQTRGACPSATRAARRAAGACARSPGTKTSYTATWSSLHHSGVHAAEESAGLGAQNVGVGDGQVVTGYGQIEVVFQG